MASSRFMLHPGREGRMHLAFISLRTPTVHGPEGSYYSGPQPHLRFDCIRACLPSPSSKLWENPKLIRSLRLDKAVAYTYHIQVPTHACWCKKGEYNAETSQKSELCGFQWANTHKTCVHDPV